MKVQLILPNLDHAQLHGTGCLNLLRSLKIPLQHCPLDRQILHCPLDRQTLHYPLNLQTLLPPKSKW